MSAVPLLQTADLCVAAAGQPGLLLDHVDLRLGAGERLGLVGASGSGKSLIARSVLGLLPSGLVRCAGSIHYRGQPLTGEHSYRGLRGRELAYVFQDAAASLHPLRTLGAQLHECLRVHAPDQDVHQRRERIRAQLDEVGLPDSTALLRRYPHQLSGGQRQRMLLALTLLPQPRVLIADEPTSALDPVLAARICRLLSDLVARRGMSLLFISHDLPRVAELCDRIQILQAGRTLAADASAAFLSSARRGGQQTPTDRSAGASPNAAIAGSVLAARELSVRFESGLRWPWQAPPRATLRGLDLQLARGERLGVVGSSGSGKSTLLRALLRVLWPLQGDVLWFGERVSAASEAQLRARRWRMQMVFQDPYRSLDPMQRVDALLSEALARRPAVAPQAGADAAKQLLAAVGLSNDALLRYPAQFSGGQRQRLAIARALACEPEILLCDEATSALDRDTQAQVLDLLDELARARQLSLIFVAHDLAAIERLCERLIVLEDGVVVEQGNTARLLAAPQSDALRALCAARPQARTQMHAGP